RRLPLRGRAVLGVEGVGVQAGRHAGGGIPARSQWARGARRSRRIARRQELRAGAAPRGDAVPPLARRQRPHVRTRGDRGAAVPARPVRCADRPACAARLPRRQGSTIDAAMTRRAIPRALAAAVAVAVAVAGVLLTSAAARNSASLNVGWGGFG